MDGKVKLIVFGVGPIGQSIIRSVLNRNGLELVGAYDIDPNLTGRDLGEICGLERTNLHVTDQLYSILPKCDLVVITTTSSIKEIYPQVEEVVKAKKPVLSTSEELSFPWNTHHDLAEKIDRLAYENGVAVLSTGVNPGFLMDIFPIFLTTVCLEVRKIKVERFQDASFRRVPFQKKIGVGDTLEQFNKRVREGSIKHVGFPESIHMIAHRMNWKLDEVDENISPIVAEKTAKSEAFEVIPGNILGVKQLAKGIVEGKEKIILEMQAYLECDNPHDSVWIDGNPGFHSVVPGGINGDVATAAAVINSIPQIFNKKPGLRTMADMPVTSFYSEYKSIIGS